MEPIDFKHSNKILQPSTKIYSENIDGVKPMHIFTDGEQCISCWHMTWRERISALMFGNVWIAILSGESQPPIYAEAAKTYLKESK